MKVFCIVFTSLQICFFQIGYAQSKLKQQALIYFEAGKYHEALQSFNEYKKTKKDPQLLIKRGLCFLYTNKPDDCIKDMVAAEKLKSLDNKRYKYLGLAYMSKYEYAEAAKFFKLYLNTLSSSSEWKTIVDIIRKCGFALNYKFKPQLAFVENLGQSVNTIYDDFGPVQSPTRPEKYYFSSSREGSTGGLRNSEGLTDILRGKYSADMYTVDLVDGNWSTILPLGTLLNTPQNDILQDFSQDGSIIYFIKSDHNSIGHLYTDTFIVENIPSKITPDSGFPFDAAKGDKDLFVFNDSLIIFASNRTEGLGGYDLYYSLKTDENWRKPVAFKYPINTEANEIAPFIIDNGSVIYFSSDRSETYGGYDIFYATFTANGQLDHISNAEYPINSPGNDTDMEISHDGMFALFASDRNEGYGGKDLYTAYFKDQITGMLESTELPLFVSAIEDDTLSQTSITSESTQKLKIQNRDFVSKSLYFVQDEDILNQTNQNTLKSLADLMLIYPTLKLQLFSHFTPEGKKDIDLYFSIKRAEKAAEFLAKSGVAERRIQLFGCGENYPLAFPYINNIKSTLAGRTNRRIDFNILNTEETNLNVIYDYPVVAEIYRDSLWDNFMTRQQGLTFRVQFVHVAQMLKNEVLGLSNDIIIEKNLADKMYTYTMGNYVSYDECLKMQNYLKSKGFEKAHVIPYYKGASLNRLELLKLSAEYPDVQKYLSEVGQ